MMHLCIHEDDDTCERSAHLHLYYYSLVFMSMFLLYLCT